MSFKAKEKGCYARATFIGDYNRIAFGSDGGRVSAKPMRRDLAIEDLGDLLQRPLVAILATYRANGEALLSPVWHEWRDGGFTVVVGVDDAKARHLRRDPRGGLVVFDQKPPYRGIELRGRARFVEEGVLEAQRRIARRYLGDAAGAAYSDSVDFDEVIVRLEPGIVRAWDFSDDQELSG